MGRKTATSKLSKVEQAVTESSTPSSPSQSSAQLTLVSSSDAQHSSPEQRDKAPKVNTSSLADLKNTCDDVVKEVFVRPTVAVAAATAYYSYVTPFHDGKFWTSVGVAAYMTLSTLLTIYIMFVEQNVVFDGKRRTFASRITTERLTISSQAFASEKASRQTTSFPLSLVYKGSHPPNLPTNLSFPAYHLAVKYNHSSNNGKSLIHEASADWSKCFGEFFDEQGTLAKSKLERELQLLLEQVMKTS
ncbi:hypothetical protein OIV83_002677 [Microbotryomycetes sp. JL201]|nr:hypothetical protein OIV83_002677 [Microbotryomycetes sp. JL201]